MKTPNQLPIEVLAAIVSDIQQLLWLDVNFEGDFWSGDKEWDGETLEYVAAVLEDHGLRPDEPLAIPTLVIDGRGSADGDA